MRLQLRFSEEGQDKDKRIAIAKKTLHEGKMSLKGILKSTIQDYQEKLGEPVEGEYSSLGQGDFAPPPPAVADMLKQILHDAFVAYDKDKNGKLEQHEIRAFLKDFHENISDEEILDVKRRIDTDNDDSVSFNEFVTMAYHLILSSHHRDENGGAHDRRTSTTNSQVVDSVFNSNDDGEEEEEIPEEFTDLSPEEQQKAIKMRAFKMLSIGTIMVIYFSDPMVDVMQEIAVKAGISPFYVSFVLAPLASNASEVVASMFYAAKKTRKTMTVSLSALEGAACMNNTFW
jgi:Ca2+/Na+ antiporter